ncbi:MAG: DUF4139 domain-containing protein [Chloroflexota bacterium]
MRKWLVITIVALLIAPMSLLAQDETAPETGPPEPPQDGVALTIYNQGTALVQDRRTFRFGEGITTIDFTDVAGQIDPTSVVFTSLTDPLNTVVLEQNYIYDLVGAESLYARYLDEEIRLTLGDGTEVAGILLSARGGSIIIERQRDNSVLLIDSSDVRDVRFPFLPEGLITRPTLRWLVTTPQAGDQQVELNYLTGGINWTADYNLLLNTNNNGLDLNGWVTLNNTSGTAYTDAQVKLIAGDVNRAPAPDARFEAELAFAVAEDTVGTGGATQREFFEYQLYEINRRVTVGNNETKQVEFVTGTDVTAQTFFVYNASQPFFGYGAPIVDPGGYGLTGITDVQNYLSFSTGEDQGLGADLPAGRVRVYQEDTDGAALLIGENRIDHTPQGEEVEIYLGNAFDLVGERTQTEFNRIASNVVEESFEINLRNRKDNETVEIRVPERLYRWSNWEIVASTDDFEQINSNTIEFRVNVEPGEERTISYTVRYTFPNR